MAVFVCEEKTFWKGRLYKPGERISYPAEHADKVPRHFARVDEGPVAEDGPEPELMAAAPAAPAKPAAKPANAPAPKGTKPKGPQGYDQREVAFIAGLQTSKRAKLLAKFEVSVPGNASTEEIAKLIIDAAKAKGIDPLHPTQRAKIEADPAQPELLGTGAEASAPPRKADPEAEAQDAAGTPISETLN